MSRSGVSGATIAPTSTYFGGREAELARLLEATELLDRLGPHPAMVIEGGLNSGKTALLHAAAARIAQAGWWSSVASATGNGGLAEGIARAMAGCVGGLSSRRPGSEAVGRLRSLTVSLAHSLAMPTPFDAAPAVGVALAADASINLAEVLAVAARSVAELGTGLFLLVDDADRDRRGDLDALLAACGSASQFGLPIAVAVSRRPGPSWSLHHELIRLGPLDDVTMAQIARNVAGREWPTDAVEDMVRAADGVPGLLALYARHALMAAGGGAVTVAAMRDGRIGAYRELIEGAFGVPADRLNSRTRRYLLAIADLGATGVNVAELRRYVGESGFGTGRDVPVELADFVRSGALVLDLDGGVGFGSAGVAQALDALR
jgi:hypothetical protein